MSVTVLKVGDEVLAPVRETHAFRVKRFMVKKPVERLTKTQIVVEGKRYRKEGLCLVGEHYEALDLDLTNDQTPQWAEHKEKIKCCYMLPSIAGLGRVSTAAPLELLKRGADLMEELKKVYASAKEYEK